MLKEKYNWQNLTILISPVRNNFIKNVFTAKFREFKVLFFYWTSLKSKKDNGMHLVCNRCKITSSVAILPIMPKIALAAL